MRMRIQPHSWHGSPELGIVEAGIRPAHDELFLFEAARRWHACGNRTVYAATDV